MASIISFVLEKGGWITNFAPRARPYAGAPASTAHQRVRGDTLWHKVMRNSQKSSLSCLAGRVPQGALSHGCIGRRFIPPSVMVTEAGMAVAAMVMLHWLEIAHVFKCRQCVARTLRWTLPTRSRRVWRINKTVVPLTRATIAEALLT